MQFSQFFTLFFRNIVYVLGIFDFYTEKWYNAPTYNERKKLYEVSQISASSFASVCSSFFAAVQVKKKKKIDEVVKRELDLPEASGFRHHTEIHFLPGNFPRRPGRRRNVLRC